MSNNNITRGISQTFLQKKRNDRAYPNARGLLQKLSYIFLQADFSRFFFFLKIGAFAPHVFKLVNIPSPVTSKTSHSQNFRTIWPTATNITQNQKLNILGIQKTRSEKHHKRNDAFSHKK